MPVTSRPVSVLPAMASHGNPAGVPPVSVRACARALARARAIRSSLAAVPARSRARRTAGPPGASPSTGARCASRAMPLMLAAPAATAAASDTSTMPRPTTGDVPFSRSAQAQPGGQSRLAGGLAEQDHAGAAGQAGPAGGDLQGMVPPVTLHGEQRSSSGDQGVWQPVISQDALRGYTSNGQRLRGRPFAAIDHARASRSRRGPGSRVQVPVHDPLRVDPVPAPDAAGQGDIDPGRLYPQLGDALPLGLQEREAGEKRGDLVAARGRDELEQETSLVAASLVEADRPVDAPERELSHAQAAGSRFQRRQQPAPQAPAPHGGSDREVIDRPEPAAVQVAEHDASDLLCVFRGQHHRRLAGQPVAEQAGARPSGRQGREDPQEELAGKVQLLRRPDRLDRDLAHDHHYEHRNLREQTGISKLDAP